MTKVLIFEFENDAYVIKENATAVFSINAKELIFNSLDFYNGIYKDGKSTRIEFRKNIMVDPLKKGEYIYNWLSEIISHIAKEFNEEEVRDEEEVVEVAEEVTELPSNMRPIPKYELKSCAGDGFNMGDENIPFENVYVRNPNADFAVTVSGFSMEPTLPNGSVLLVKKVQELNNKEIGIFLIDGASMCKRYNKYDDGTVILTPDNSSDEYESIQLNSNMSFIIQGRVLDIYDPLSV